jgi:hypothetical protein
MLLRKSANYLDKKTEKEMIIIRAKYHPIRPVLMGVLYRIGGLNGV